MNTSNFLKLGTGFGLGYLSRSMLGEVHHTGNDDVSHVSQVLKTSKNVYDAAQEHPERIPEAIRKATVSLQSTILSETDDVPKIISKHTNKET